MYMFSVITISSRMAATCLVHPLEGILALYSGLSAGLVREAAFTSTRIAIIAGILRFYDPDSALFLFNYTAAGCISSFIWTPIDLVLVRMAADSGLPLAERRNYKNVFNALFRIVKEEGFFTLWRGVVPTVSLNLNVLIWCGQFFPLFTFTTENFSVPLQNLIIYCRYFYLLGLTMPIILLPFDYIKTMYQNMKTIQGKPEYSDTTDAIKTTNRKKGYYAFWRGFIPYYVQGVI